MLNISELGSWLEEIDTWFIVTFAIVEVGIDLVCHNQRSYQDTIANVAIGVVYALTNTVFGYAIAFSGILFFSQFSPIHLGVNLWTTILAVAIAGFLYYWEHRTEHRIRFFWAYHSVHHSSTDYNLTVAARRFFSIIRTLLFSRVVATSQL